MNRIEGIRFSWNRQNTRSFGKCLAGNPTRPLATVAPGRHGSSQVTSAMGWVQNEDRRPKTQKRRPLQNRLEITLKWFERDYRPTQKQETTRFAVLNEFDQGLRFVHNPTKCTKRRPPQNRLEITSNWFERDCGPKQKRETARFAFINKFDKGLRFVHNPTKCTKRRPPQHRLEITSKWFERDCRPKQKRETARFAFINKFDQGLRFVHNPTKSTKRRPLQNRLEITSKWFERDCQSKQKQETT